MFVHVWAYTCTTTKGKERKGCRKEERRKLFVLWGSPPLTMLECQMSMHLISKFHLFVPRLLTEDPNQRLGAKGAPEVIAVLGILKVIIIISCYSCSI